MTLDPYAWCQRNGWDLPDTQWARTAVGVLWDAFGPLYRLNSCDAAEPSTNQPTNKENIMSEAAKVITVDGVEYRQAAA